MEWSFFLSFLPFSISRLLSYITFLKIKIMYIFRTLSISIRDQCKLFVKFCFLHKKILKIISRLTSCDDSQTDYSIPIKIFITRTLWNNVVHAYMKIIFSKTALSKYDRNTIYMLENTWFFGLKNCLKNCLIILITRTLWNNVVHA